ncbi:MAG TPA: sigma-70 family RNA polymerase sigma factor [Natronosporangium sp.]
MTAQPYQRPRATPDRHWHQRSDPALIAAVRNGDLDAFGPLYLRHVAAARRLARGLARDRSEADDLVAEAFANLLAALRRGSGPTIAFRAYLLTTVRNLFYDRRKHDGRVSVTDDLSNHDPGVPFVDTALASLERTLVARAFARLPERWQTVLWHTQVEGESPATVAAMLGLTPNGVATLAYRARERLRQNYLREHVTTSPAEACRSIVDRLGAYVRNGLSARDRTVVDGHLADCRRCHVLFLELGDVNAGLRGLVAPALLGDLAVLHISPSEPAASAEPDGDADPRAA